jgi:hypothetical protein
MPVDLGLLKELDDVGVAEAMQDLTCFDQACVQIGFQRWDIIAMATYRSASIPIARTVSAVVSCRLSLVPEPL